MDKKEIVSLFLQEGFFLEDKVLDFLYTNQEKISLVLERAKKTKKDVISLEMINSFFEKVSIEVLKEYRKVHKNKISPQYLRDLSLEKFNKLKVILEENKELYGLVSISKINTKLKEFSLIVNLIEKDEDNRSVVVEDLTGSTTIYFSSHDKFESIEPGDIIGVRCKWEDDKIFATKVIYPDIPLKKDIARAYNNINCIFITIPTFNEENFNRKAYENFLDWAKLQTQDNFFIFIFCNSYVEKENIFEFLGDLPENFYKVFVGDLNSTINGSINKVSNPCILGIGGVKLLLFKLDSPPSLNSREFLIATLRKRYVKLGLAEEFVIDVVPDLFVCSGLNEVFGFNYKGITLLSIGNFISQPIFWMINLATRETIKIDFS